MDKNLSLALENLAVLANAAGLKIIVTVVGLFLTGFIAWFFFGGQKMADKPTGHEHHNM